MRLRHGSWLPADHRVHHEWLRRQVEHVDKNPGEKLIPVLQEFKEFIEADSRIYMYFTAMWDEIPLRPMYQRDPTGHKQIRDYNHMLAVLNHTFNHAPEWTEAAESVGMVGVPLCGIFDYAMGTSSGHAAFLDPGVNRMLKKVLNEWGKYLQVCEPSLKQQPNDTRCYCTVFAKGWRVLDVFFLFKNNSFC